MPSIQLIQFFFCFLRDTPLFVRGGLLLGGQGPEGGQFFCIGQQGGQNFLLHVKGGAEKNDDMQSQTETPPPDNK